MVKKVELKHAVISDAVNTAETMTFANQYAVTRSVAQVGEVRRYAGGRYRAISRIGKQKGWVGTFRACQTQQVSWLEEHVGRVVCLRDWTGLKLFAVYFEVASEGIRGTGLCDVTLTLQGVTFTESAT